MPMQCRRITVSYFKKISPNEKNKCITISGKNETPMYHETASLKILNIKPWWKKHIRVFVFQLWNLFYWI